MNPATHNITAHMLDCRCVPGADAMSREGVGLMAAIMSGHTSMVNEVLRQAGAPALAAAQVSVHCNMFCPAAC